MARMRKRRKIVSDINVVPYIDVMLVLLLIFMVTAPLMNLGVEIELPNGGPAMDDERNKEPLLVTIDQNGKFFLTKPEGEKQPMDAANLQLQVAAIVAANPKVNVLIAADKAARYGQVYEAMALLKAADAKRIAFMGQPDGKPQ
jgi:biopolymer transport protein TolR